MSIADEVRHLAESAENAALADELAAAIQRAVNSVLGPQLRAIDVGFAVAALGLVQAALLRAAVAEASDRLELAEDLSATLRRRVGEA